MRFLAWLVLATAAAALAYGSVAVRVLLLAPEEAAAEVIATVKHGVSALAEQVVGVLPSVRLGHLGGQAELDRCDGTFIEMEPYRIADAPPVFAAHNNCGGDVILMWEPGQRVMVGGVEHVVVDVTRIPKLSGVGELAGMPGELVLQSCYYGSNVMRFVSLDRVGN